MHKQEDEDYDGAQESLSRIIASREALVPPISESFHPSAEPTLLSLRACKVTPFSSAVGRLTLSSQAVYFQPFVNSPDPGEGESSQRQPWPVRFRLILVCFRLILVYFRMTQADQLLEMGFRNDIMVAICIKIDEFCINIDGFCIKMMSLYLK